MTAEDRLDILERIGRYSYAADEGDAEGLAALFTADGVFARRLIGDDAPETLAAGREALAAWARAAFAARPRGVRTRHHQRATVFDAIGEAEAGTRTMLLVTRIGPGDRHPVAAASGLYRDEWRRTGEGWRIARRVAEIDRPRAAADGAAGRDA